MMGLDAVQVPREEDTPMRLTRCLFSDGLSFGPVNLRDDRRGTVAVTIALCATVLFGFAGLAVDVASWQVNQRSVQGTADAAAYSAAVAYSKNNGTSIVTQAEGITAARGYVAGQNGVTVAVNQPPTSGPNTGIYATAIEVIIQQPQARLFSGLFLSSDPTVTARAVATVGAAGNGCVIALDKANIIDVSNSGGATLNLNNCSLYVNSDNTKALNMSGGATINACSAFITGGYATSGGASLNTPPTGSSCPSGSGTFTGRQSD
jgi:Flp pilus assembly protein TadG